MKRSILLVVIISTLILSGCDMNKTKKEDEDTEVNNNIPPVSEVSDDLHTENVLVPSFSLTTEEGIREYLVGEWIFDKEYVSDVVCKMSIDEDLNVDLIFEDTSTDEAKGEYTGRIKIDRQYADLYKAPDLLSIELIDADYPGGDFFFLHRTTYDDKHVMSLFFAGNGDCIFDLLGSGEYAYSPSEIIFEKENKEIAQFHPRKNDEFYAIYWGRGDNEESIWIDDIHWIGPVDYDFEAAYPGAMTLYENDVLESVLYNIASDRSKDILEDGLFSGEVYLVKTDRNGNIIELIGPEDKKTDEELSESEEHGFILFENAVIGEKEMVKSKEGFELIKESGPFEIKTTDIEVLNFNLLDEYKEDFENKDKLTVITMAIEVENNSTDINSIYPLQGMLSVNTKEEVEADMMLSDEVGGEFLEGEIKTGKILFILDTESEEIDEISYVIEGAVDEDFNLIGEDIEFKIEF